MFPLGCLINSAKQEFRSAGCTQPFWGSARSQLISQLSCLIDRPVWGGCELSIICRVGGVDSMRLFQIHIETILIKTIEQSGNNR
jgi:hypothetical protein